jgi:hypothetical protein
MKRDRLYLRAESRELERWRRLADAAGVSLSTWVRARLNGRPLPASEHRAAADAPVTPAAVDTEWERTLQMIASGGSES